MEESLTQNLTESIKNVLGLKEISPAQLSPLVLAYIGDSIFDRKKRYTKEVVTQNHIHQQKMLQYQITEELQALRLLWDICTLKVSMSV